MEVDSSQLPAAVLAKMQETHATLSAARKAEKAARKKGGPPEGLATTEEVGALAVDSSHNLHKSSPQAVLAIDLHGSKPLVVTGGADKAAHIFDYDAGTVVASAFCDERHMCKILDQGARGRILEKMAAKRRRAAVLFGEVAATSGEAAATSVASLPHPS